MKALKMRNTLLQVTLLTLISINAQLTLAQSPPPDKTTVTPAVQTARLDPGELNGVDYVNRFFGLSLSVPRDWVVVGAQRRAQIGEEAKKMIVADTQKKEEQVAASIDRSTTLISLTKLPAGQPGNASFMLIAERIPSPAIRSGEDVLRALERLAQGTNFKVEFQGGIRTESIGGADFGVATIKNSSPHGVFMQKIYVTVKSNYGLQLFFTYLDEADLPVFEAIIKSVQLK